MISAVQTMIPQPDGSGLQMIIEPVCRNPGGLKVEVIVRIADRMEAHYLS